MIELSEVVDVFALFKNGQLLPQIFSWKGRGIKIDKINLVHTTRDGANLAYHFSVSAAGNFYRLAFDTLSLKWILEAVDADDSTHRL